MPDKAPADKNAADKKEQSLTLRTEQALRQLIVDGPIQVGDKLPTALALAAEFGVSRTVIREAVAALRADGLLQARHGVGVFVSSKGERPETEGRQAAGFSASVLDLLELRAAIEVQAACLAALRRSWAQEARIWEAAEQFAAALKAGASPDQADWRFHRSISEATNNLAFVEFFDKLGLSILPRRALAGRRETSLITTSYLEKSVHEHRAICEAIGAGDAARARAAVEAHLGGSQSRYKRLIQACQDDAHETAER